MENRTGSIVPDGCTFTYFNKKGVKCDIEGCERVYKHVDRYYLFKWGNKKICRFHAKQKRII